MEIDLVLVPFRIDTELCLSVLTEIRWDMFLSAHECVAHDILVGGIGHEAYLGVEVDVPCPGVEPFVSVKIW